ncbi:MAG: neutral zinc metallopeptidase [Rhodocyclaceae bacterium]|nr:neutral zinc metallopeptidase [Rhodocyclaceae bacterium]
MRWDGNRESGNIEDRRGGGGGGGGMPLLGGGRIGMGTLAIALIGWLVFDINPVTLLEAMSGGGQMQVQQGPAQRPPTDDPMVRFVSVVLADTEDVWRDIFSKQGAQYRDPRLVLFTGATPTACGTGQAAMGPFYCPADEKVYIDLGFYETMRNRLGAPGDFAQAYVIAHEVGHHVQNLLGISEKVQAQRQRLSEKAGNALSVRQELQADCFAGVWAHHAQQARQILESGDLEEALNAASQIGDDTLQRSVGRAVVPDSFTHGSGKQRVRWFREGFEHGDMHRCNTFQAASL